MGVYRLVCDHCSVSSAFRRNIEHAIKDMGGTVCRMCGREMRKEHCRFYWVNGERVLRKVKDGE